MRDLMELVEDALNAGLIEHQITDEEAAFVMRRIEELLEAEWEMTGLTK